MALMGVSGSTKINQLDLVLQRSEPGATRLAGLLHLGGSCALWLNLITREVAGVLAATAFLAPEDISLLCHLLLVLVINLTYSGNLRLISNYLMFVRL
jgi:hypothetical protein